jgi:hypothetical protein
MKLSNIDIGKWFNADEYTLGFVADFKASVYNATF